MVCMKELFNDSKCLLIRSEKDEMSVVEDEDDDKVHSRTKKILYFIFM